MIPLDTSSPFSIFVFLLTVIGTLAVSISVHEASHAWTAWKLGDPTAKHQGRVSLNPMDHIDPIGTVILPLFLIFVGITTGQFFLFGWAKPTPFNPWNLSNPKRDSALISFAGPASNALIVIILILAFRISQLEFIIPIITLNVTLAVFNLIPVAPLDGFKVVAGFLPKNLYYQWMELERYGPIFLMAVIFFGQSLLGSIIDPILGVIERFLV